MNESKRMSLPPIHERLGPKRLDAAQFYHIIDTVTVDCINIAHTNRWTGADKPSSEPVWYLTGQHENELHRLQHFSIFTVYDDDSTLFLELVGSEQRIEASRGTALRRAYQFGGEYKRIQRARWWNPQDTLLLVIAVFLIYLNLCLYVTAFVRDSMSEPPSLLVTVLEPLATALLLVLLLVGHKHVPGLRRIAPFVKARVYPAQTAIVVRETVLTRLTESVLDIWIPALVLLLTIGLLIAFVSL